MRDGTIRLDFNNMLSSRIGEKGLSLKDIEPFESMAAAVHTGIVEKHPLNTWQELPNNQKEIVLDIEKTAKWINETFDNFVVLGIGGSALGSKALFSALKHSKYNELPREKRGGAKFYVADNIDPVGMCELFDILDVKKTIFHVITKSGNTVETVAQMMAALDLLKKAVGDDFKRHIIITTNKETGNMKRIADENGIKQYIVPEGVGGRFSVLSPVGLLSAAVLNIHISDLLAGAAEMYDICKNPVLYDNPAYLYAMMYCAAMKKGANISVTMPYCDGLRTFTEWIAQLWAESLGKRYGNDGSEVFAGQTPVSALGVTDQHSQIQLYTEGPFDKVLAFIEVEEFSRELIIPDSGVNMYDANYLKGQDFSKLIHSEMKATRFAVTKSKKMNMTLTVKRLDAYHLGALFFFYEMATAAAGEFLKINAFDQPGVEEGKLATLALMKRTGYEDKAREIQEICKVDEKFKLSL